MNERLHHFGRGPDGDGAIPTPRPDRRDTVTATPANPIIELQPFGYWTARPRELSDDIADIASGPFSLDKSPEDPNLGIPRRTYFLLDMWDGLPASQVARKPERYARLYETTWRRLAGLRRAA